MNIEQARYNMIEQQIRPWDVLDPRVLDVLREVPREDFVPPEFRELAFVDMNIRLPHGQVMMQPKLEARLLQEITLATSDRVLEIGTGSGYMTALLGSLAGEVDTVDIFPDFLESARAKLSAHDINNVNYFEGDGSQGWNEHGSYDAIVLTGSVPQLPESYRQLLNPNGRLIAVVGEDPVMEALLVTREAGDAWTVISIFDTSLPPLVNAQPRPKFVF